MSTTAPAALTESERRVIAALDTTTARTPADLKKRMPGATPVGTIRALLGSLAEKGLVETATSTRTPGVTAWVLTEAGSPDGMRAAALAAALPEGPSPERAPRVAGPMVRDGEWVEHPAHAEPRTAPSPRRVSPPCDHIGCPTHARNVCRVTADGGVVITLRLCQRHTLALGERAEVTGGVR